MLNNIVDNQERSRALFNAVFINPRLNRFFLLCAFPSSACGDLRVIPITHQEMNNLFWPDANSIEQCFAAHIVQCCHDQQYCSTLLHLIAG